MDKPESILAVVMVGTHHAAINGDWLAKISQRTQSA
jgi:hypothetical protein